MADSQDRAPGTIVWFDLTVPDAENVRDFYASVVGWRSDPVDMGEYADYVMKTPASGEAIAGVRHARGENADLPQWLTYVVVANLDASLQRCTENGGSLISAIKSSEGDGRYCVIRDPAGAVLALMQIGGA